MPAAVPGKRKPQEPLNAAGLGVYRGAAGSSMTSLTARNSLAKTAAGNCEKNPAGQSRGCRRRKSCVVEASSLCKSKA